MKPTQWLALLGQRDEPTDAIEDYCEILATALRKQGCTLELFRVQWMQQGWPRALAELRAHITGRQGQWALVQYTGLSWSRRGFPFGLTRVIRVLMRAQMKVAIVFHDPDAFGGRRLRDRLRRRVQLSIMRRSARLADKVVSTISPDQVPWMQNAHIRGKVSVMPVGSNFPICAAPQKSALLRVPAIIVFGFSELEQEAALIAQVLLQAAAAIGDLRLVIFGRGSLRAEPLLRKSLQGSRVNLEVLGILPDDRASALLAGCDLQLFVRSGLSARRGSAIAGIACGLPIVGFSDRETAFPVTEAGVRLVPVGDAAGLAREIICVLQDETLRDALRYKSLQAARQYFSWDGIAASYISALG